MQGPREIWGRTTGRPGSAEPEEQEKDTELGQEEGAQGPVENQADQEGQFSDSDTKDVQNTKHLIDLDRSIRGLM